MASSPFPPPIQTDSPHRKTFQMLLLTFPKQGGQPGRLGCMSVCECVCRGGGGHGLTPAWPGAGRKEARYSRAGVGSRVSSGMPPHKGTLSPACAMNSRVLAGGVGRSLLSPLPGQVTLAKSLPHSGPYCPPSSVGSTPCSSKCGPCTSSSSVAPELIRHADSLSRFAVRESVSEDSG